MDKRNKKKAFTLAEVLITLVVIGVIAAISLPVITVSYKKHEMITRLKKSFSVLSAAVNMAKKDHSDFYNWDTTLTNKQFAEKYILPYVVAGQTKETYAVNTLSKQHDTQSRNLFWSWNKDNNPIYYLANGSTFVVTVSNGSIGGDGNMPIWIIIDTNGAKGPNEMGVDAFSFNINPKNTQLVPTGYTQPRAKLLSSSGPLGACVRDASWQYYRGATCAAVIIKDNWQIKDDYPWK